MFFSYIETRNIIKCVIIHTNYFVNIKNQRLIFKIKQIKSRKTAFRTNTTHLFLKYYMVCTHLHI